MLIRPYLRFRILMGSPDFINTINQFSLADLVPLSNQAKTTSTSLVYPGILVNELNTAIMIDPINPDFFGFQKVLLANLPRQEVSPLYPLTSLNEVFTCPEFCRNSVDIMSSAYTVINKFMPVVKWGYPSGSLWGTVTAHVLGCVNAEPTIIPLNRKHILIS